MRRRDFIKGIAGSVVWPLAASAQQPEQMRRIGILMKIFYSPSYTVAAHSFETTRKSRWIAKSLAREPIAGIELVAPKPTSVAALSRVHDPKYVDAVRTGYPRELAESQGFDWDPGLWEMVCASNGGVAAAAIGGTPHPPRFWVALERTSPCASSPRSGILHVQWPCPRCPCGARRRRPYSAHS